MKRPTLAALSTGLFLLGGCAGVLDSDREPVRLYTLEPPGTAVAHDPDAISIALAAVDSAPGLHTDRMLLRRDALRLDHFSGARWAATTPVLVRDYLGAALLTGNEDFRLAGNEETPDYELGLDIRTFEADYRDGEPPVVRIDLVAALRDVRDRRRVMLVRRSTSERAADNTLGSVARAFDGAMESVASQIIGDIVTAIGDERG